MLVKKALNSRLPFYTRYSTKIGRAGTIFTAIDAGISVTRGAFSDSPNDQIYYTTEGFLKLPSALPVFGFFWGLGFDPVIRPVWENGAEFYRERIDEGMDPSVIFIMPGLGYCPEFKGIPKRHKN